MAFMPFCPLILISLEFLIQSLGARSPQFTTMVLPILCYEGNLLRQHIYYSILFLNSMLILVDGSGDATTLQIYYCYFCHIGGTPLFSHAVLECRYLDAIKSFNQVLLYIFKTKQYHQRSSQYDQILKKNEQMYALLAISLSLCPHPKLVDENVNNQLREKYAEKMLRMQHSDEAMFDELFSYACPKFITPAPPNYDEPLVNFNQVWGACKPCAKPQVLLSCITCLQAFPVTY